MKLWREKSEIAAAMKFFACACFVILTSCAVVGVGLSVYGSSCRQGPRNSSMRGRMLAGPWTQLPCECYMERGAFSRMDVHLLCLCVLCGVGSGAPFKGCPNFRDVMLCAHLAASPNKSLFILAEMKLANGVARRPAIRCFANLKRCLLCHLSGRWKTACGPCVDSPQE